jgi:hypothetical protein
MSTLFSQKVDLSEGMNNGVTLHRRSSNQDIYTLGFSTITIKHSTKRGAPELIESNLYIAGEAYDVFDVWVLVRHAIPGERSGLCRCIAEDCLTFDEAITAATAYLTVAA